MSKKIESIESYLARGGVINKLPTQQLPQQVVRSTSISEPAQLMTLAEAELFYSEPNANAKPKKIKSSPKIDLDILPEKLRLKYINKLREEMNGEEENN